MLDFFKFQLTEFHKRVLTTIFGLGILFLFGYFELIDLLAAIIYIILYSELLIVCYESKAQIHKRVLVFIVGMVYLFLAAIAFPDNYFSTQEPVYDAMNCLFAVFAIDTSAYIFGKLLKGPKLMPKVSPNKTISGFIFGTIAGTISFHYFISSMIFDDAVFHIYIGILFAFVAQAGDLLVSYAKRVCKVKHSSFLLPGHGGLWDRFDSICAAMIFIYILQLFFIGNA